MSGRPAPPGRRGSVKKETFKADEETTVPVAPVVLTAAERQKLERDEEMKQLMAQRKKAQEEELSSAQRESDAHKEEAARKKAEQAQLNETRKAAEEAAVRQREAEETAQRRAEDERAQTAKRAEEEAASARAAAKESARAEEDERVRSANAAREREEAARRQTEKQQSEEKARAEAKRLADEETARVERELSEKLRLQQDEEDRQSAEEEEQQRQELERKRKAREADEARRQAEQAAFLQQQQELEEQQRRMDEKRARQKAEQAEAAATEQRERERSEAQQREAAAERERLRAEAAAARAASEQAEIARLREEEAQRQQAVLAEQAREQAAHEEEARRLEAERVAALEEARRAEAAISELENVALEEKRRRAEAQRKKREMFLSDLDSFSTTFEAKSATQDESIKQEQDKHYELLAQQMKEVEAVKASMAAKEAQEAAQRASAVTSAKAAAQVEAEAAARAAQQAADAAAEAEAANKPPPTPPAERTERYVPESSGKNLLGDLTSTLFTASAASAVAASSGAVTPQEQEGDDQVENADSESGPVSMTAPDGGDSDGLRVPTRIGSGKTKQKPVPYKPAPAAVIVAKAEAAIKKYSEDEEEEGTGEVGSISNVLTLEERRKMTLAQKETWRAKQADLTEKRKDFHGVVTYTFDGVFAWQMYGSAEAVDESGSNYTEYLMRCQWGTTFDNMQPWIVAHRYREFDQLDQALKRKFPRLEPNMPKLPKKDLFRALSSDVVAERRGVLEEYMSKIVNSMPSLLRSELMNDFLDITNRISGIRMKLLRESNKRVAEAAAGGVPAEGTSATPAAAAGSPAPVKGPAAVTSPAAPGVRTTAVPSNSKYGIEDPLAYNSRSPLSPLMAQTASPELFRGDTVDEPMYWTLEEAESARDAKHAPSLDEDSLGHLETDIRSLGQLLRKGDTQALLGGDSKFRAKLRAVSKRWPNLRATCVVGMGVDFTLIPRAMQAEEDLLRYLNEFRNIETASKLVAPRMTAV